MRNKRCLSRFLTCKTHVYPCTTSLSGGFGPRRKQYQSMHTTIRVKLQNYTSHIKSCKLKITNHKLQITTNYLQVVVTRKAQTTNYKSQTTNHKSQIANYKLQLTNHKLQITTNYLQVIVTVERHLGAGSNGVGHFHVTDPHCCRSFVKKNQLFDKLIREIYLLKIALPIDRTVERDVDLHCLSFMSAYNFCESWLI